MTQPPDPEDRVPAAWLVAVLEETGVSQSELGRRLGMKFKTVNRWANDHVPLKRARWVAILAVLELPPTWQPPKRAKRRK